MGDRCTRCGACEVACPRGVHDVNGGHRLNRDACLACGRCVDACPHNGLALVGRLAKASDVVAQAVRLKPFFANSGGGVTLTGGEVTGQVEFAAAILEGCQREGIHTAIETCGACSWERLLKLAELADLVLFDLKLMDDTQHRRWVGSSNGAILANAAGLAGGNVEIRVPLVPGITDTDANLSMLFEFMVAVGLTHVALLPYNPSAGAKYEWLGMTYTLQGEPQSPERLAALVGQAQAMGLAARVG